jgi:hypothetical protein
MKLMNQELEKAKKRQENLLGDATENISIAMLIFIALLVIVEVTLTVFALIFTFKCHSANNIPTWLFVLLLIFLFLPSPIQPMLALVMTIYGSVSKCSKSSAIAPV